MSAQIIDGKEAAKRVRAEVKQAAERFSNQFGRPPGLEAVLVGEDPASQVYVRNKERASNKAGIRGKAHRLPADTSQASLLELVRSLNADPAVDGILVQMPLPDPLDAESVIDAIDPGKDVDGLTAHNAGLLALGRPGLVPCTPLGCMRLLADVGVELQGKRAVIVGRSNLVGKPIAQLLLQQHATVTLAHSRTRNLDELCREADVLVAAVGRRGLVKGDWVKPEAVVLDVGINRAEDGKLYGDVEFDGAAARASHITPVPGGVGPMTIAMLLHNTVEAARRRAEASAT